MQVFFYRIVSYLTVILSLFNILRGQPKWAKDYTVDWNESVGTVYTDIAYGDAEANKFDLYVPADGSKDHYGLVVYIHGGGFTSGDKSEDASMLEWLCSKGYVAAGINYTLRDDEHTNVSVYTQSLEIREAMPYVVKEAARLGYPIDKMAIGGGSAGHCLAMLYAYRDADSSPVPVTMSFGAVGPSSFYPEDWLCYGFDKASNRDAAAQMFGVMAGKEIAPDLFGTPEYDEAMKDISALLWIDDDTVPSVLCYGKYDTIQSYQASIRLDKALTDHGVQHEYIVCKHSGHSLQNDRNQFHLYYQMIEEYLNTYLPV